MASMDAQAMLQEMFQLKDDFASTRRDLAAAARAPAPGEDLQSKAPLHKPPNKPAVASCDYNAAMDPENPFLERKVQALQIAARVRAAFLQRSTISKMYRGLLWARVERVPRPNRSGRPPTAVKRSNVPEKCHGRPESHRRLSARCSLSFLLVDDRVCTPTPSGDFSEPQPVNSLIFIPFGKDPEGGAQGSWVEERSELEQALVTMTQCELDLEATIAQAENAVGRADERVRVCHATAAAVLTRESAAAEANIASLETVVPVSNEHSQLLSQAKQVAHEAHQWLLPLLERFGVVNVPVMQHGAHGGCVSVASALTEADAAELAVQKAKEEAVPAIQACERALTDAREDGKVLLKEAAIAAAKQLQELEEKLSRCDDQGRQLQVVGAVRAARQAKDEANRMLTQMGVQLPTASELRVDQNDDFSSTRQRVVMTSTGPAPIAPSVMKENKAAIAAGQVEERAAGEHCARAILGLEQRALDQAEVRWQKQVAAQVAKIRADQEEGGLAWLTCAQALDRIVATTSSRDQAFSGGLLKSSRWASRHFTAPAVLAWRLHWLCSGDASQAVNHAALQVDAVCRLTTQHCRWTVEADRAAEIAITKAAAAARKLNVNRMKTALVRAITGRCNKTCIRRWSLSCRKDAKDRAIESRGPLLQALAVGRKARVEAKMKCKEKASLEALANVVPYHRFSRLRRAVRSFKTQHRRFRKKKAGKRDLLVQKVRKGGAEELWAHLTADPADDGVAAEGKSHRSKASRGLRAGACSVMDTESSRSVFDRESRRRRRGVLGQYHSELESICSSRGSFGSSASLERSCSSAPPVLSLLQGSTHWAEADRIRRAGESAAVKARDRANQFKEVSHEQMNMQVNQILKASGTRKFGRRRNAKNVSKLMKQLSCFKNVQ